MKTLFALVGLVVLANAALLAHAWWNRTLVRSEFELSEIECSSHGTTRKGRPASLHCYAGEEVPRRTSEHPGALQRNGYAVLSLGGERAQLTAFSRKPEELAGEGNIVVPAQHHPDWGTRMTLPPMPLAPAMRTPQPTEKFRAKIRLGRNYEPWLIDLQLEPNP